MTRLRVTNLAGSAAALALSTALLVAATDPPLVNAVRSQDKEAARVLLKQRVDVNATGPDGTSALHWAAHWNDTDIATLLIGARANVNAQTDLGVTPVYLASEIGSAAMVEKLLAAGANPNLTTWTGVSPLMQASRAGATDAVTALLAHKADPNAQEKTSGQSALMLAVAQGHPDVVRALVAHGADVNLRSAVTSFLVNRGGPEGSANNAVELARRTNGMREFDKFGGNSALLFAARNGDIACAKELLAGGASVNDAGADGNSALVVAAHSARGAFATFLLASGANPNAAGAGYTVLHAAVLRGDLDLVKESLAHGANPNAQYTTGTAARRAGPDYFLPFSLAGGTPYLLAAKYADVAMMRVLAGAGADLSLPAKNGTTPLMAAASADHNRQGLLADATLPVEDGDRVERETLETVRTALEFGADINAADNAGNTAVHIVTAARFNSVIQLLAEKGARLDAKNKLGQTPLALASGRRGRGASAGPQPDSTADLLRKLGATE